MITYLKSSFGRLYFCSHAATLIAEGLERSGLAGGDGGGGNHCLCDGGGPGGDGGGVDVGGHEEGKACNSGDEDGHRYSFRDALLSFVLTARGEVCYLGVNLGDHLDIVNSKLSSLKKRKTHTNLCNLSFIKCTCLTFIE